MKKRNTKEIIFLKAVDLYSEKGYRNVSIRELAGEVGIKESSIYNHYRSKEDIFNTILEYFKNSFEVETPSPEKAADYISTLSFEEFTDYAFEAFKFYLGDKTTKKIWKILSREKFSNEKIRDLFKKILLEDSLNYQTEIFRILKDRGIVETEDPFMVAHEFQAFNVFLYFKFIELDESEEDNLEMIKKLIKNHLYYISNWINQKFKG